MLFKINKLSRKKKTVLIVLATILIFSLLLSSYYIWRLNQIEQEWVAAEQEFKKVDAHTRKAFPTGSIGNFLSRLQWQYQFQSPYLFRFFNFLKVRASIDCVDGDFTDDLFNKTPPTKTIKAINLSGTKITDEAFQHFLKFPNIHELELPENAIQGNHLDLLSKLPKLSSLKLSSTSITDKSLFHFNNCKELRYLNLSENNISDQGVLTLKTNTNLKLLYLGNTNITDISLHHISNMKNITLLFLDNHTSCNYKTKITDSGIKSLVKLKNLKDLHLEYTSITDKCISDLIKITSLKYLDIEGTKITNKGFQQLKTKLPRCQVDHFGLAY